LNAPRTNFEKTTKRIDGYFSPSDERASSEGLFQTYFSPSEERASSEGLFQTEFKNKALSFQPSQVFSFEGGERERERVRV
jgi:hypothetical protein